MTAVIDPAEQATGSRFDRLIKSDKVHGSLYTDPTIFAEELRNIWYHSWVFVGHESEVAQEGDYVRKRLGLQDVIMTRDRDGQVHLLLNRCAHRGNLVCLKQRGHAKDGLTCVYHAWRYDLAGNLTSVAFRRGVAGKGGMPESFKREEHGLKKLRTDSFAGIVVGTLSPEAPPLAEYIGNDIGGRIGRVMRVKPKIIGTTSQILHNNWKLYVENVKDTYHASLLHTFFATFRISRLTSAGGVHIAESGAHHASYTEGRTDTAAGDKLYAGIPSLNQDYRLADPRFLDVVDEIGDGVTLQILSVFPNFVLQQINNAIALRLVLPKGPDATELQWTYLGFEDDDAAMTERRLQQANLVGPAGYIALEDGCVGGFVQRALNYNDEDSGVVMMGGHDAESQSFRASEAAIRGFWKKYRALTGA